MSRRSWLYPYLSDSLLQSKLKNPALSREDRSAAEQELSRRKFRSRAICESTWPDPRKPRSAALTPGRAYFLVYGAPVALMATCSWLGWKHVYHSEFGNTMSPLETIFESLREPIEHLPQLIALGAPFALVPIVLLAAIPAYALRPRLGTAVLSSTACLLWCFFTEFGELLVCLGM